MRAAFAFAGHCLNELCEVGVFTTLLVDMQWYPSVSIASTTSIVDIF